MNKRIWLSLAQMGGEEQSFIKEAFDTNWVVPLGPNVNGFEQDLKHYHALDKQEVVALSAGTAALHLGLIMLGVERDDEVICQSFTFSASANPITYQGAKPVFVDSEPDTWNMDPALLREAIEDRIQKTGRKPKAIIPVHLYGMPAKMDEIIAIAQKYEIPILEDAAEAIGSEYKGKKCGTLGTYGALSFNGNKMITTSGGGALICPNRGSRASPPLPTRKNRLQLPAKQHLCRYRSWTDASPRRAHRPPPRHPRPIQPRIRFYLGYRGTTKPLYAVQFQFLAHHDPHRP